MPCSSKRNKHCNSFSYQYLFCTTLNYIIITSQLHSQSTSSEFFRTIYVYNRIILTGTFSQMSFTYDSCFYQKIQQQEITPMLSTPANHYLTGMHIARMLTSATTHFSRETATNRARAVMYRMI